MDFIRIIDSNSGKSGYFRPNDIRSIDDLDGATSAIQLSSGLIWHSYYINLPAPVVLERLDEATIALCEAAGENVRFVTLDTAIRA